MAYKTKDIKTEVVPSTVDTEPTRDRKVYIPRVDILETADGITLCADMPGVSENTVDITLEKGVLTIQGTVEPDRYEKHRITYAEYDIGDFRRSFSISDIIDQEKIEASMKDGVLWLTLPKAEPAKPKKIDVKPS
ncbi:MAG: Hsp20/alpha crystallin family protein [Deltaproteobacteria bacterium]|nr:Hsp20/alpha crystallin family protein [Deltaproteobacteria bacterium]